MYRTNDPVGDYRRYCEECEKAFDRENDEVHCAGCGKAIGRLEHYQFEDDEHFCMKCGEDVVRKIYISDIDLSALDSCDPEDREDIREEIIEDYLYNHKISGEEDF